MFKNLMILFVTLFIFFGIVIAIFFQMPAPSSKKQVKGSSLEKTSEMTTKKATETSSVGR